jgi:hypothetical protein
MSSGLNSVVRIDRKISNWSVSDTQRIKNWIRAFGHTGVNSIAGHVISHAVGAPAQGQFTEIAGSKYDRLMKVGKPK